MTDPLRERINELLTNPDPQKMHQALVAVLKLADELIELAPPNNWGKAVDDTIISDVGRGLRQVLDDTLGVSNDST